VVFRRTRAPSDDDQFISFRWAGREGKGGRINIARNSNFIGAITRDGWLLKPGNVFSPGQV